MFLKSKPTCETIVATFNNIASSMCCHPTQPWIAIGNENAIIEIWDIDHKKQVLKTINLKQNTVVVQISIVCMQFTPDSKWLIIATNSHYIKIYETVDFTEKQFFKCNFENYGIENLCVSFTGEYFAFSQNRRMSIYRYFHRNEDAEQPFEWILIGSYIAHQKRICSMHFAQPSGMDDMQDRYYPRLFSLGEDRIINEFNLQRSSITTGVRIQSTFVLTLMSHPILLYFWPEIKLNKENWHEYEHQQNVNEMEPKFIDGEWKHMEGIF